MTIKTTTQMLAICLTAILPLSQGAAQEFALKSFTVSGGGGFANGGSFGVESTVGQLDASAPMTGGNFSVTGGFWSQTSNQEVVEVAATNLNVTRGNFISGGTPELMFSDNLDLRIVRSNTDIQSRTEFELTANSPTANPTTMQVQLEGSVFSRTRVDQIIELFNFRTNGWEEVDSRAASRFADSVTTIELEQPLSRFVEPGTNNIDARIRFFSPNPRQVFTSNTDQFIWLIQ